MPQWRANNGQAGTRGLVSSNRPERALAIPRFVGFPVSDDKAPRSRKAPRFVIDREVPEVTVTTVHHLNCGTFKPLGVQMVTHVLLCETADDGLVLVDTGIGMSDAADPSTLGAAANLLSPDLTTGSSAYCQIRALGLDPADVTNIVATHLDYDHISGASDFPHAMVHLTEVELTAALGAPQPRYRRAHIDALTGGRFKAYAGTCDALLGFSGAYPLAGLDGLWLVPLQGHSAGHAAVAVRIGNRWILHAGDAFFHHSAIGPSAPTHASGRRRTSLLEKLLAADRSRIGTNHRRLSELAASHEHDVQVLCSHDRYLFDQSTTESAP